MRIQSRLGKLERSAGRGVDDIRRPAEVPKEIWRPRHGIVDRSAAAGVGPLAERGRRGPGVERDRAPGAGRLPQAALGLPDPRRARNAEGRIAAALERAGTIAPGQPGKMVRRQADRFSPRVDEASPIDHCLPHPYSESLLEHVGSPQARSWAAYYACQLRRGAMTPAGHAAELAKFLPPFTRADLEETARSLPLEILGYWVEPLHASSPCSAWTWRVASCQNAALRQVCGAGAGLPSCAPTFWAAGTAAPQSSPDSAESPKCRMDDDRCGFPDP